MDLFGITGSLREKSYNTALLRAFGEALPGGAALEIYVPGDLPLYNADIDPLNNRELDEGAAPARVVRFRERVAAADALVFATPEYNYGVPGVLKNAIDWASRPAFRSSLTGKPAGILSASTSAVGGARAQAQLRQALHGSLVRVFPHVEMLVGGAREKFDDAGNLTDGKSRERIERYAGKLVEWVGAPGP